MPEKILIVDDEEITCVLLNKVLRSWGYEAESVSNGADALRIFQPTKFDLVITDLKMPGMDGIQVLEELKKTGPEVKVIIMTAFGTIETAVSAIKKGAVDFITKPLDLDSVRIIVERALKERRLARELENLKNYVDQRTAFGEMVGASPPMKKVYQLIDKVAPTDTSILIQGETGTGKELVARAIHLVSPRRERKFVPVACSALPETLLESELFGYEAGAFTGAAKRKTGLIEYAEGGTVFLDEITDISAPVQAKLLRVIQEREFNRLGNPAPIKANIRLITATNKNIQSEVQAGRFREDLYYRINVVVIELPPLRERKEDIPVLVYHFLDKFNARRTAKITDVDLEAMIRLTSYSWPGNIRQLENVIERAVSLDTDGILKTEDLPVEIIALPARPIMGESVINGSLKEVLDRAEKNYLVGLLKSVQGNVAEAARRAGLSHATFYEKLKKHLINQSEYR